MSGISRLIYTLRDIFAILSIVLLEILGSVTCCAASSSKVLSSSPYCGLYCLYAASKELGHIIPFVDLLKPQYVTSAKGSSLGDLELAAHNYGFNTLPFGNGTLAMLRTAGNPVILHISPSLGAQEYTHFVLLLHYYDGNRFLIMDPDGTMPLQIVSPAALLASWDKSGLVISRGPINAAHLFASSWLACLTWIVVAATVLLGLVRRSKFLTMARPETTAWFAAWQGIVLLAAASGVALAYNCFSATGFIRHPEYIAAVEESHIASFLPDVAISQISARMLSGAVLVDARLSGDYQTGHIPGAINVPINCDPETRASLLASIPRNHAIIIYCENKDCPFSRELAIALNDDGYTALSLVDGGYEEWVASRQTLASK